MNTFTLPGRRLGALTALIALAARLCLPTAAQEAPAPVAPITGFQMTYRLGAGSAQWPAAKRQAIVAAMDAAIGLYNQLGQFPKSVTAYYSPGTPTADGNYNGTIRFGGQIGFRVALHELGHVLGVGQHPRWNEFARNGLWTGPHALAQLRAFDGPDAVLHCDSQHFWPYGLNFDKEGSPENFRRHVLMVAALRRDMGIVSGEPLQGLAGVGTWGTQAEFKDITVTQAGKTLFHSDFAHGLANWKTTGGQWQAFDGALRQTGAEQGATALVGGPSWHDYTLTLKARKLGGDEGFLIVFGSPGNGAKTWWNVGGWGNTQIGLEAPNIAAPPVPGRIETGPWYDIKVELQGPTVKCSLDGKLVQQAAQ